MEHWLVARVVSKLKLPSAVLPPGTRAPTLRALVRAPRYVCVPVSAGAASLLASFAVAGWLSISGASTDSEPRRDSARQICHLCLGEGPLRAENVSTSPKIIRVVGADEF